MNTLALWIWQARAWTEPQSILASIWIGLQIGVLLVAIMFVLKLIFDRNDNEM